MMLRVVLFTFLATGALAEYLVIPTDSVQSYANFMKEQCKKNGAEDKFEQAENAGKAFETCLETYLNAEEVKVDIDAAKSRAALNEVVKKYCKKAPQVKTCTQVLFDGMSPCVDPSSRYQLAKNSTDLFIDFLCENDGIKMTSFISEGGVECFKTKMEGVRECADSIRSSFDDSETAQKLSLVEKCEKYDQMAACMVNKVKGCNTTTLANLAEELFKFIRRQSPCNEALPLSF